MIRETKMNIIIDTTKAICRPYFFPNIFTKSKRTIAIVTPINKLMKSSMILPPLLSIFIY